MLAREPKDVDMPTAAFHRSGKTLVALYVVAGEGPPPRVAGLDGVELKSTAWFMSCISHFRILP